MQNLPIANSLSVTPAQTPTQQDNGATQTAEPFDSVLARQRASATSANSGKTASSATGSAATTTGNSENPDEAQAQVPGATSEMLTVLLPATADRTSGITAAKDKTDLPAPDGDGTLPGNMLAALLPAMGMRQDAAAAVSLKPGTAGGYSGAQPAALSLFRAQDNASTVAADIKSGTLRGDTFSAALETLGKDAASALSHASAQISAQGGQPDTTALITQPQNGVAPIATNPGGAAQVQLSTPLTSDAWTNEFNQQITWLATQHEQTAELHLNPPHLGPLDVVLSVSGDQATALFTSPHAAVRNAVEQALPKLREMLADNGITLGNAMVSDQSAREQQAGLANRQQKGGDWPGTNDAITVGGAQPGITAWSGRRQQGMVDTFA